MACLFAYPPPQPLVQHNYTSMGFYKAGHRRQGSPTHRGGVASGSGTPAAGQPPTVSTLPITPIALPSTTNGASASTGCARRFSGYVDELIQLTQPVDVMLRRPRAEFVEDSASLPDTDSSDSDSDGESLRRKTERHESALSAAALEGRRERLCAQQGDLREHVQRSVSRFSELCAADSLAQVLAARGQQRPARQRLAELPLSGRQWNQEHQTLLDAYDSAAACFEACKAVNSKTGGRRYLARMKQCLASLSALQVDFVHAATLLAQRVVLEFRVADELKTVKPLSCWRGEQHLGGRKYLHDGIFIKVSASSSADECGDILRGDEPVAVKLAAHEFRALSVVQMLMADQPELRIPLFCDVQCYGRRVTCVAQLPIAGHTLVCGSQDGGQTLVNKRGHPVLDQLLSVLADRLQLAPHEMRPTGAVGGGAAATDMPPVLLPLAFDIEGHLGLDGRYYLVDCARLCPPEHCAGLERFYRLLRTEFMRSHPERLCADTFSAMLTARGGAGAVARLRGATEVLQQRRVPAVAAQLTRLFGNLAEKPVSDVLELHQQLVKVLHSEGVNLRYLGWVLLHTPLVSHGAAGVVGTVRMMLVREMLARCIKDALAIALRATVAWQAEDFNAAAATFLNRVFVDSTFAEVFWTRTLKRQLREKYFASMETGTAERAVEWLVDETDIRTVLTRTGVQQVLSRVCALTHLEIAPDFLQDCAGDSTTSASAAWWTECERVQAADVRVGLRVRESPWLLLEEGHVLCEQQRAQRLSHQCQAWLPCTADSLPDCVAAFGGGEKAEVDDGGEGKPLLEQALSCFAEVLRRQPDNHLAALNAASALHGLSAQTDGHAERMRLLRQAQGLLMSSAFRSWAGRQCGLDREAYQRCLQAVNADVAASSVQL